MSAFLLSFFCGGILGALLQDPEKVSRLPKIFHGGKDPFAAKNKDIPFHGKLPFAASKIFEGSLRGTFYKKSPSRYNYENSFLFLCRQSVYRGSSTLFCLVERTVLTVFVGSIEILTGMLVGIDV